MIFHLIYTIVFSLFVSSLLISYDLFIKNFKLIQMHRNFKIIMAILLFISQVYFVISFSLNSVGYVVYEYTISLFIYYFGFNDKKIILLFLTQITTLTYFMMLDFKDLKKILFIFLLNVIIVILFKLIKKLNTRKHFKDTVFFVSFVLTNIVSLGINSNLFFRREITIMDIFAVIIGSSIIVNLWLYYISNQKVFLNTIDRKIYERNYDELTKLKNYRSLNEELSSMDSNGKLIVVILDLDHFKKINDNFGHKIGNMALEFFSDKLMEFIKNQNVNAPYEIYRYGGEEFLIAFQTENLFLVKKLITSFQNYLVREFILINQDKKVFLHFSAGIAMASSASSYLRAIKEADAALYQAKKNGRNQVVIFESKEKYS